ncbi:MAG: Nif11-like leader peptide family natural product precursor [Oscillospiraceae bacterium]|nr:Nif11-like leader peptide family natural product precursor [Clostridiales bacterium]
MNENVTKFFERYEADAALRDKVAAAEAAYPGSLEIRKAVAEEVLLPIAAEIGLPFTIDDLRAYETKRKFHQSDAENAPEDSYRYWLLGYGWESNEAQLCGDHD